MDPTRTFCRIDFDVSPEKCKEVIDNLVIQLSLLKGGIAPIRSKNLKFYPIQNNDTDEKIYDDPFVIMDPSPFKNITAFDIASIDTYFNLTKFGSGLIAPQLLRLQSYVISGSSDLGMAEYIQFRNILTFMYFFNKIEPEVNQTNINIDRMLEVNIPLRYFDYQHYISTVLNLNTDGVDVFIIQDYTSDVDLIYQIIIMLNTLKSGGDFLALMKNVDSLNIDLITIFIDLFDSISLFKPCTLGLYNDKFYLIGKNFVQSGSKHKTKNMKAEIIRLLKDIVRKGEYHHGVGNILENENPEVFKYVSQVKTLVEQERSTDQIISYVPDKLRSYLNLL